MGITLNPSHIIGTAIGGLVVWLIIAIITKDIVVEFNDEATGKRGARVQKQIIGYNIPSI